MLDLLPIAFTELPPAQLKLLMDWLARPERAILIEVLETLYLRHSLAAGEIFLQSADNPQYKADAEENRDKALAIRKTLDLLKDIGQGYKGENEQDEFEYLTVTVK